MQDYRKEQIEVIRRNNGGAGGDYRRPTKTAVTKPVNSQKKPFVAKGHDAILKGAQDAGGNLRIVTMNDGQEHVGKMIARDKFTITIEISEITGPVRRTFYKHAIESFEPVAG